MEQPIEKVRRLSWLAANELIIYIYLAPVNFGIGI